MRLSGKSVLYLPVDFAPGPLVLPTCIRATAHFLAQHVTTRGLFRVPGSHRVVDSLFAYYCSSDDGASISSTVRRADLPLHIEASVHDVASTFKRMLSVLPGGILGSLALFDTLFTIRSQFYVKLECWRKKGQRSPSSCGQVQDIAAKARVRLIALLIVTIKSPWQRELICAVFGLLSLIGRAAETASREDQEVRPRPKRGLMGYDALGIVFGPLLIADQLDKYLMGPNGSSSGHLSLPWASKGSREQRKPKASETQATDSSPVDRLLIANGIAEMLISDWRHVVRQIRSLGVLDRVTESSVLCHSDSLPRAPAEASSQKERRFRHHVQSETPRQVPARNKFPASDLSNLTSDGIWLVSRSADGIQPSKGINLAAWPLKDDEAPMNEETFVPADNSDTLRAKQSIEVHPAKNPMESTTRDIEHGNIIAHQLAVPTPLAWPSNQRPFFRGRASVVNDSRKASDGALLHESSLIVHDQLGKELAYASPCRSDATCDLLGGRDTERPPSLCSIIQKSEIIEPFSASDGKSSSARAETPHHSNMVVRSAERSARSRIRLFELPDQDGTVRSMAAEFNRSGVQDSMKDQQLKSQSEYSTHCTMKPSIHPKATSSEISPRSQRIHRTTLPNESQKMNELFPNQLPDFSETGIGERQRINTTNPFSSDIPRQVTSRTRRKSVHECEVVATASERCSSVGDWIPNDGSPLVAHFARFSKSSSRPASRNSAETSNTGEVLVPVETDESDAIHLPTGSTMRLHFEVRSLQRRLCAKREETKQLRRQLDAIRDADVGGASEMLREARQLAQMWKILALAADGSLDTIDDVFTARLEVIKEAALAIERDASAGDVNTMRGKSSAGDCDTRQDALGNSLRSQAVRNQKDIGSAITGADSDAEDRLDIGSVCGATTGCSHPEMGLGMTKCPEESDGEGDGFYTDTKSILSHQCAEDDVNANRHTAIILHAAEEMLLQVKGHGQVAG